MLPASCSSSSGRSSITRAATPKTSASPTVAMTLRRTWDAWGGAWGAGLAYSALSALPAILTAPPPPRQHPHVHPRQRLRDLAEDLEQPRIVELRRSAVEDDAP